MNYFHIFTHNKLVSMMSIRINIIILGFACFWGACSKIDQGEGNWNTQAGKQSFGNVENNIGACMSFFDLALRLNAYESLSEEQRSAWQDIYFPTYRLEQNEAGHWLGIKDADTVFTVKGDQLAMTTESSVWELDGCCEAYQGILKITCTGIRCWTLDVISVIYGNWMTEARLKVMYQGTEVPVSFREGDWLISGSGKNISLEKDACEEILNFDFIEPLITVSDSKYLFNQGMVFMTVKDSEQQRVEMVKAELHLLPEKGRHLKITYMGNVFSYSDEPDFIWEGD